MTNTEKRQNALRSKRKSKIIKRYNKNMFWPNIPYLYACTYIKKDWFELSESDFIIKYMAECYVAKNKARRNAILMVLKPLWNSLTDNEKNQILIQYAYKMEEKEIGSAEELGQLTCLSKLLNCRFLEVASDGLYNLIASTEENLKVA